MIAKKERDSNLAKQTRDEECKLIHHLEDLDGFFLRKGAERYVTLKRLKSFRERLLVKWPNSLNRRHDLVHVRPRFPVITFRNIMTNVEDAQMKSFGWRPLQDPTKETITVGWFPKKGR